MESYIYEGFPNKRVQVFRVLALLCPIGNPITFRLQRNPISGGGIVISEAKAEFFNKEIFKK
ncbi:hypothetical protein SAMN05421503_0890 [Terribacillus aidingensis]|uniref:Uncharacterized protein n=1 Tax=Terribacillus aidingensis TaxID=586416 RepID=A0A285N722_9BACI|nr:hypothetical protein SAMN05421503_0890 [Terribacillus aidingensis]